MNIIKHLGKYFIKPVLVEHGLLTKRIYVSPSSYYRDIFENLYSHSTLYLYVIVVSLIIQ